jgi:hypothetical protein
VQAVRFLDSIFPSDLARAKAIVGWLRDPRASQGIRLPWASWEFTYESVGDEFLALVASLRTRPAIQNHREVRSLDRPQLCGELLAGYTAVKCAGGPVVLRARAEGGGAGPSPPEALPRRHDLTPSPQRGHKADIILGLPFETLETYTADAIEPSLRYACYQMGLQASLQMGSLDTTLL